MIYGLISTDHAEPQFFPASECCPSAARSSGEEASALQIRGEASEARWKTPIE